VRALVGVLIGLVVAVPLYLGAIWFERFGRLEPPGTVTTTSRPPAVVDERGRVQRASASALDAGASDRQILFGDLHVHTTYSMDAFLHSLPLMQGEGAHPPADACDFARFCSALDFFSLNDHAEGLSPDRWRESLDAVRQCNAVAGDALNPDLVAFAGWEWTQMGATPEKHYGHKNVIFRETASDRLPTRPIASGGRAFDAMRSTGGRGAVLAMSLFDFGNREAYFDLGALRRSLRAVPVCDEGVDVRSLPDDCAEAARTPRELFTKLDQWGFDSIVIPHGNAWGNTTPAGVSWDKQLAEGNHDPDRQTLLEVYSGHGNSEEYRPWRHVVPDGNGGWTCPEPGGGFEPGCWRAGEIIRERCENAGIEPAECERRVVETRKHYVDAADAGRFVVPGQRASDWLDAGQCRDCFQPDFDFRPGGSSQYALAISGADPKKDRFRFGFIASSDTHFARPATGYKEFTPDGMTDAWGTGAQSMRKQIEPGGEATATGSQPIDPTRVLLLPGGDVERSASFYYTGGLVAVHAEGRDRDAIWRALDRKEVYGTSGPRILLWFDLLNGPDGAGPSAMGSEVAMAEVPRFLARAIGAFEQRPGCPDDAGTALGPERLTALCKGECYHPSDARHAITRIEVVRIRPRRHPNEDVAALVEDPWRVLPCPGDPAGCVVEFEDPDHAADGRDAVYYVRAIQQPTPHVNGDGLRCTFDEEGICVEVRPCRAGAGEDDCLAPAEARAWSSPIFVDFDS